MIVCATVLPSSGSHLEYIEAFVAKWQAADAGERSHFQKFAIELFDILGVGSTSERFTDGYNFDFPVKIHENDGSVSQGFIDLYKRDCFVMEAKQGSDQETEDQLALFGGESKTTRKGTAVRGTKRWSAAMQKARLQAERYAKASDGKGWPPFIIVVDVGHCFEIYADFSLSGKSYAQFPDAQTFRISLDQLRDAAIRSRLATIWNDPFSLDPSRHAEEVTKDVSRRLAVIARALEEEGHHPERVAGFLTRCLFSMFAEDVGLLNSGCFTKLLETMRDRESRQFVHALETFWGEMDRGTPFSSTAGDAVIRFNGGLFKERTAIPLKAEHLGLLIEAAEADWRHVEPAIFGTFLEQALDPIERKKLGAEFTPRRWVERLILPTVIEPLRKRWENVQGAALAEHIAGRHQAAIEIVKVFHHHLCHLRILDPACGTGNFLYVTMEHLKRLEGEVLDLLRNDLDDQQAFLEIQSFAVDPQQFLGIEQNPRAAQIAEVVLWIGYLQWHYRLNGDVRPAQPVLKDYRNIENRDAILTYDHEELIRDDQGKPVTRWDGRSMRTDLVTGRDIPDESKRIELYTYVNPRPAIWPDANYIVGNPPFIGGKDLRERLGGYAEALWSAYHRKMPKSADFVMYWWYQAAERVRLGEAERFGLITTNSLPQTFNRRVVASMLDAKKPLSLLFAIPDHPWYLDGGMAAVRISMTVGVAGKVDGDLFKVIDNQRSAAQGGDALLPAENGKIQANLSIGADLDQAKSLVSNGQISSPGVKLHGAGFIVTPEKAEQLGLGKVDGLERHIRHYRNGKDLTHRPRGVMVIDFYGLDEGEVRARFPAGYQHVLQTVKPERDQNNRKTYRENWWIFGEPRSDLRPALDGLSRYISTVEIAKHRVFQFLDASILPDNKLVNIALDDAFFLGVLSSRTHTTWAIANQAPIGVYGGNVTYTKTRCFDPFPFPNATDIQRAAIRDLAEELDAHRKRVLTDHADLTLTGLYNVLEKLRAGEALSSKEQDVHERGLVSVMRHLHVEIDRTVADAYSWPADLPDAEILARLVALNQERIAEEAKGNYRYLRPAYQAPKTGVSIAPEQAALGIETALPRQGTKKPVWPKSPLDRITIVRAIIANQPGPATLDSVATSFKRRPKGNDLQDIVNALVGIGAARRVGDDRYAA